MAIVKLTKDQILDHVKACWKFSDDRWIRYEKRDWDLSWQLYESKQDWSDKKKWQAKVFWPKTEGVVDTTVALIKRGIMGFTKDDWYNIEGFGKSDKENDKPIRMKKVVGRFLNEIGYRDTLLSSIKTSLLCSIGIIKTFSNENIPIWDYDKEDEKYKPYEGWEPSTEEVDPYDVRFSHDMKLKKNKPHGTYIIERIVVNYVDLMLKADSKGYIKSEIDEIRPEDYPSTEEDQKYARDSKQEDKNSDVMNPVELKEFHGYIHINPKKYEQNKGIGKNEKLYEFDESLKYVITTANGKQLIRVTGQKNEQSYPNPDQTYVYTIIRPFQRKSDELYGKCLVKSIAPLQIALNDIWCLNLDNAKISILKLFGVDVTRIYDTDDLEWSPGNLIRTEGPVNEIIQELLKGSLPPESQWIPLAISSEIDRHSGVTPSVEAGIPTQGANTATEFAGLMQQSALKFEDLAKTIELQATKVLESILDLILTMPDRYKWMVSIILEEQPEQIQELFLLNTRFDINITGISGMINKIQTQNKLLALLQILGPMASTLGVNIRPIVKGIIRANEDVIDSPVEEIFPDVPMLDLNMIGQILSQIDPALPFAFMQMLQQLQSGIGGGRQKGLQTSMRTGAQPSTGGATQTSMNPMNWLSSGGPQG